MAATVVFKEEFGLVPEGSHEHFIVVPDNQSIDQIEFHATASDNARATIRIGSETKYRKLLGVVTTNEVFKLPPSLSVAGGIKLQISVRNQNDPGGDNLDVHTTIQFRTK